MKCYIVKKHTGEYSDYRCENIKVFSAVNT